MDYEEAREAGCTCPWSKRRASMSVLDGSVVQEEWKERDGTDPQCPLHGEKDD